MYLRLSIQPIRVSAVELQRRSLNGAEHSAIWEGFA